MGVFIAEVVAVDSDVFIPRTRHVSCASIHDAVWFVCVSGIW